VKEADVTEPTITCPKCQNEIKLTESLAAPLIASTKREFESRLTAQNAEFTKKEQALREREAMLAKERESVDHQIAEKLKLERAKIAADESKKAKLELGNELEQRAKELTDLQVVLKQRDEKLAEAQKAQADLLRKQRELDDAKRDLELTLEKAQQSVQEQVTEQVKAEKEKIAVDEARKAKMLFSQDIEQKVKELSELQVVLKQRDEKLAEAQKAQAELIRKQRELDDAKREMELTIEKRVQESLTTAREQGKKEAGDELQLRVMEKEQTILGMQKQIEELKRKAEQGSQQLQGEVLELQLESILSAKFPHDSVAPVPKGEHGGDLVQKVITPAGSVCGTILWESKRTKNWQDGWLSKLREDQRAAKAEIAVIVTTVLPKGVETFGQIDGVWITHPRTLVPVAMSLRQMLIEVNCARQATEGQQTKMEMIYQYLTGSKFRLRVQAIVEAFSNMADDLTKEKKTTLKQWAKREEQITRVMEATVGMYGELQGIAGKTLQEIDGLEPKLLEDSGAKATT